MPLMPSPVPVARRRPAPFVLCPGCIEAIGSTFRGVTITTPTSGAWPSANLAIGYPFSLPEARTALQLWMYNGATAANTRDIGIADSAGNLLVSAGSTAAGSANLLQVFNTTDLLLMPDTLYYMWMSASTNTDAFFRWTGTTNVGQVAQSGAVQMASAFALPSTITAAAITSSYIPFFGAVFAGTF
jgi:hypothetical protein